MLSTNVSGNDEAKKAIFVEALSRTPRHHISKPTDDDKTSVLFIAHEFLELWCRANGLVLDEIVRILRAEILPYWWWRDGRSIKPREVIERLDVIVKRGSKVVANRISQVMGQMFKHAIAAFLIQKHSRLRIAISLNSLPDAESKLFAAIPQPLCFNRIFWEEPQNLIERCPAIESLSAFVKSIEALDIGAACEGRRHYTKVVATR